MRIAENQDGEIPPTESWENYDYQFLVTPLLKGYKPWQVNIFTMNGGSVTKVIDGILYRLIKCDSVEMFADTGVYVGVSSEAFCDNKTFNYDEKTGETRANSGGEGISVIFELPIDKSKADPVKAKEFLETQGIE